jgi:hypothetical protein
VGKGEAQPITLKKDQATFKAGDILTEEFIGQLSTNEDKDVAHQLNRRTVFRILATDFDPNKPDNTPAPAPDKGKPGAKTNGAKPGAKKP